MIVQNKKILTRISSIVVYILRLYSRHVILTYKYSCNLVHVFLLYYSSLELQKDENNELEKKKIGIEIYWRQEYSICYIAIPSSHLFLKIQILLCTSFFYYDIFHVQFGCRYLFRTLPFISLIRLSYVFVLTDLISF